MKNLFGILAILLLNTGVFGQTGGWTVCDFEAMPFIERCPKWFSPTESYSFEANGKTFLLSYDTSQDYKNCDKPIEKRNIYLHRLDENGWVIASDLVKTDFIDIHTRAYDVYYQRTYDLNGLVDGIGRHAIRVNEDGSVNMKFLNFYSNVKGDGYNYRWDVVTFVPNGDETYKAKMAHSPNIQMKEIND